MTPQVDESYRRAALFLARKATNGGPHAVLLSSPTPRSGTTTAALQLAAYLQGSYGLRPIVVELNRARPALARMFSLDDERTLKAALDGTLPVRDCVQTTSSGLSVIPCGSGWHAAASSHRLASGLARVLAQLRVEHDLVLIDAPPVLRHADTIIAGGAAPDLVLVVEAGRTRREVVERVSRELEAEGITVIGALLNKQRRFIPGWIYWWLAH